jgi:protein O-GlcNAc transferase
MNFHPKLLLNKAFQDFHLGRLASAEDSLKKIMRMSPNNFDAIHLLGIIYASQGRHLDAINLYKRALKFNPMHSAVLSNYGSSLSQLHQDQEALVIFKKVLEIEPGDPDYWYNTGNVLCDLGRHQEAIMHYERAINLNPKFFQAYNNFGKALFDLNRYSESIDQYNKALEINKGFIDALINKAEALRELKFYEEAWQCNQYVLGLKPNYAEVYSNSGNLLRDLKRYEEAVEYYDKAIALQPTYTKAYFNKGNLLHELKCYEKAIDCYEKAISFKPSYYEAWGNKGVALYELKRYAESIRCYEKAISFKSDIDWLEGHLLHTKMKICNWHEFAKSLEKLINYIIENKKVAAPFLLLALCDDPLLNKKASEIYTQSKYAFNDVLGPVPRPIAGEKIRVGYFSADFKNHAVAVLTAELFELHDKNRFEITAFSSSGDDKSAIHQRLDRAFNRFIDVCGMTDQEIAALSRSLHIDIAVDLGGFTEHNRPGIFAYRAAPMQLSYIGYLGTSGADYMDYIIADRIIIPHGSDKFYSEKIVYLPSYQVNDRKRVISERQFTRAEWGLPEKGFVFCCFNNNYKILPSIFESWMRILKAVENSTLFLYAENQWAEANLKKEAEARGIRSTRLVFGKNIPADEYLARYRVCDLFLDTFPYNAGTTASDALWAGLPVMTLMGRSFASRMAASLLNAIGLPELITSTQEEYETLAIELGNNPEKLLQIKEKLIENRFTTPLFDTPQFTKNLEAAFIKMHERYEAGLQSEHIYI